jgi:hypothetical protein
MFGASVHCTLLDGGFVFENDRYFYKKDPIWIKQERVLSGKKQGAFPSETPEEFLRLERVAKEKLFEKMKSEPKVTSPEKAPEQETSAAPNSAEDGMEIDEEERKRAKKEAKKRKREEEEEAIAAAEAPAATEAPKKKKKEKKQEEEIAEEEAPVVEEAESERKKEKKRKRLEAEAEFAAAQAEAEAEAAAKPSKKSKKSEQ